MNREPVFVNYAHRGASQYAPENTLSAFYLGLAMGANGIETDIHRTRDGVLVLFHDDALARVTGAPGMVWDYTLAQLSALSVASKDGRLADHIVTLEQFLDHFASKDLRFAVELKQSGVERETIDMLNRYHMASKTVLTAFDFENLRAARAYDPAYRIGYLVREDRPEQEQALLAIGGEEYCPKAAFLTPQAVARWHAMGLNVRAWGIDSPETMRMACQCGVDGMTVNFPDLLNDYRKETEGRN
jgi:glycerophosphoryl diester phosphodiesterase